MVLLNPVIPAKAELLLPAITKILFLTVECYCFLPLYSA